MMPTMFLLSSLGMHTINLPSVPAAVVVVPEILSPSCCPPILGNILTLTFPKAPLKKIPTFPKAAPSLGPTSNSISMASATRTPSIWPAPSVQGSNPCAQATHNVNHFFSEGEEECYREQDCMFIL